MSRCLLTSLLSFDFRPPRLEFCAALRPPDRLLRTKSPFFLNAEVDLTLWTLKWKDTCYFTCVFNVHVVNLHFQLSQKPQKKLRTQTDKALGDLL